MAETVQLRHLTTFGLGGTPMRYFRPATGQELRAALEQCRRQGLPWRVLGGGSNLLVDGGPLPYAAIHIHAPGFDGLERTGPFTVRVGAGVPTTRLLAFCKERGLGGLEFLAGLPGTVGGAIAGNAGAWGKEICEPLARLWLISPHGEQIEVCRAGLAFSYRRMERRRAVITEAEFTLEPRSSELIVRDMTRCAGARAERFPLGEPSAGCIFRNPPGHSAGKLLDLCGLKGRRAGGAEVSRQHANFILNCGGAAPADVVRLIEIMKEAVRRKFGIELELEVHHWPGRARAA